MKDDPFSQLGGLDQRLFQEEKQPVSPLTTKQRDNETTLPRNNTSTTEPTSAAAQRRTRPRAGEASAGQATARRRDRAEARVVERHSHDIFRDQVRWMNRLKVEVEETYGSRITSNEMVQLAIDLIIDDEKTHGADSKLIRALVHGESWLQDTDGKETG